MNAFTRPCHRILHDAHGALERRPITGELATFPVLGTFSAHRRHRGPYSGAGSLLRHLVPGLLEDQRALLTAHDVEIRAVAPELRAVLPGTHETLTSQSGPEERTRFYPGAYTVRVAHGLTDLLLDVVSRTGPRSVVFTDIDDADPSDLQFLSVLWRRASSAQIELILVTASGVVPPQLDAIGPQTINVIADNPTLVAARRAHPAGRTAEQRKPFAGRLALAAVYVASDCTSRSTQERESYQALTPAERARLHDERADALAASGEFSWKLGAIPYHRERGTAPSTAGRDALHEALEHCVLMGFYDAAIELGARCAALLDWRATPERCWMVTAKVCTALTALGRADEAAEQYELACARTTLPSVHLQAAYGRAMLYTRFYEPARRNHHKARAAINTAIAISSLLPEDEQRLFNLTFNENGLALIAMHLGDPEEALALITDGLRRLDTELGVGTQTLHRSVLRYNRAQLLARMGRTDEAVAEYDEAIAADPHHSEYHLERAELYRRQGRFELAIADYSAAIAAGPPYPEPYYNRADLNFELGEMENAVTDFTRVLDLDPTMVDALANRAGALCQLCRFAEAEADVDAGVQLDEEDAYLWCLKGAIRRERGDLAGAQRSLETAVQLDPDFSEAWAHLGAIAYEKGDLRLAEAHLTRALQIREDPAARQNLDIIVSLLAPGTPWAKVAIEA